MINRPRRDRLASDPFFDGDAYWAELGFLPLRPELLITKAASDQQLATGRMIFGGITARETAAAAVVFELYDGSDTTGVPVLELSLGGSAIANTLPQFPGILLERGLFYHVVSGNGVLRGAIYLKRHRPE